MYHCAVQKSPLRGPQSLAGHSIPFEAGCRPLKLPRRARFLCRRRQLFDTLREVPPHKRQDLPLSTEADHWPLLQAGTPPTPRQNSRPIPEPHSERQRRRYSEGSIWATSLKALVNFPWVSSPTRAATSEMLAPVSRSSRMASRTRYSFM